jgi:hypothetical protein
MASPGPSDDVLSPKRKRCARSEAAAVLFDHNADVGLVLIHQTMQMAFHLQADAALNPQLQRQN